MAKQTINQGTAPTGAGGDTFRSGSAKLQANDDEIYAQLGANAQGVLPAALPIEKGGTGATTAAGARTNLGLGTAATAYLTTSKTDTTEGRVLKVGDFGLGGTGATYLSTPTGFRYINTIFGWATPGDYPANITSYMQGIQWAWGEDSTVWQLMGGIAHDNLVFRKGANGTWGTAFIIRHSGNTTVDSNGFIKSASPIVELYADRIELNEEAKQQDITFEKLGTGDYLIKGSSGFAQEGWYIETPKDANGNVLFSVIYTTLENGDISVKTYKKKFDFETVSIVADLDNPVDITENRWIDLRLQELPQPEIEIPKSTTPPDFQPTGLAEAVATVMESYHDPEQ